MLKPKDVDFVIAHGSCPDGFGAAWTAWKMHQDKIEYFFASYASNEEVPDVSGRNVLMVDFAYKSPEIMNDLNRKANSMLLLDHHKSARDALEGKIDCDHIFDMNRSGARMAWDYFYPASPISHIIQYVEDRDLWKWKMPDARHYLAALDSYPQDFDIWNWIAGLENEHLEQFFAEGRAICRFQEILVNDHVNKSEKGYLIAPDGEEYPCRIVNCTSKEIISDVGHELAKNDDEEVVGVAWAYSHRYNDYIFSLRSIKDIDVSEIAKKFGGGGHAQASGFKYNGNIKDIFKQ